MTTDTPPRSIALVIQDPTPDLEASLYGLHLEAGDMGCPSVYVEKPEPNEGNE